MGYAITSNRIGSSELNENAFKGLALAGSFIFCKGQGTYGSITTVCTSLERNNFIIKANAQGELKCDFLCCSIFEKGDRDYETNQRVRTLMKKERIHLPSNTIDILLDRLSTQTKPNNAPSETLVITASDNATAKSDSQ